MVIRTTHEGKPPRCCGMAFWGRSKSLAMIALAGAWLAAVPAMAEPPGAILPAAEIKAGTRDAGQQPPNALGLPAGPDGRAHSAPEDAVPAGAALPPLPEPASITWRVENPFRLFADPADTRLHAAVHEELSLAERRNPVLNAERILAQRFEHGWAEQMVDKTCWNSASNRYQCPDTQDPYAKPASHTVLARLQGLPGVEPVTCLWSVGSMKRRTKPPEVVEAPCSEEARLKIPYPAGARVSVTIGGQRIAGTSIIVSDLFIVGIGDSFGSGEGNPDVPVRFSPERTADYTQDIKRADLFGLPARVGPWREIGDPAFLEGNARWLDQACHRSLYAHQLRAALQLAIEDPHRAVTFAGFACSGAEVTQGLFLRYKGNEWVPNPPDAAQISAVARLQCGNETAPLREMPEAYHIRGAIEELEGTVVVHKCPRRKARKIDLLFVSIGGNDIGFARLLANTILVDRSMLRSLGGWLGQVHGIAEARQGLETLDERYKALNRAIHGILHVPWRQADRIILTAYPEMALLSDGERVCPTSNAGMEVVRDFRLSAERAENSLEISRQLYRKMKDSAARHGWSFAEAHRNRFLGRGICAGFTDNAFSIADDLRLPRKIGDTWKPYNPSLYRAYVSRQRWFRTPNDAFMTGNFHVSRSLAQKILKIQRLTWFQLLLASTYSGAFHPTAEGHAAMADALTEQSRAVLAKYGQGAKVAEQRTLFDLLWR